MQDDSPKDYFLKALLGHGIKINPVAFNDPRSKIMCVALKYLTTDELPQMYDKALLSLMYEGSLEDIRSRVAPEGRSIPNLANAQNVNGETVLMKVCRRALSTNRHSPLAVVGLLLKSGANPMVCCDSGKNVLHDVFWSAKPPPPDVLKAMEKMVDMIHECTGRTGLLELMLSEDKHGYTPLDYVVPAQQPNWRTIVDTVVSWAACDSQDSGLSGPSDAIKDVELDAIACCDHASPLSMSTRTETRLIQSLSDRIISNLRLVTADGMTITDFMRDMDATDVRVIAQLCARNCSFLVSDCADPDAAIIAVSPAFVMETGYAPGDVLGRNCRFLQGPGTSTGQVDLIRRALATQSTVKVSLLNYKKDGGTFLNCFLLTPLHANGIIRYYIGIQNCPEAIVDDRKRNVLRLQQLRQRNTPQEPNSGGWLEGTQTNVHPTRAPQALSQSKRKVGEIEIVERQDPKSRKLNDKREKAKNQCQIS